METQQIIEVIKATAGSLDSLISETAWFFAIHSAAAWLSVSFPLLILFSILLKLSSTFKAGGSAHEKVGLLVLMAWLCFAGTLFTGVRGLAHVVQAAMAPSVYVASEVGGIAELLKGIKK